MFSVHPADCWEVRTPTPAEDLHQETWIAISRSAAAFDPAKASFSAWLFTIARHKVFDHFRKLKVAVLAGAGDDAALMLIADPCGEPAGGGGVARSAQRIVAAVEALHWSSAAPSSCFAHAGLSLEEIAQATGVAVETAKSRLRYARTKLRQAFAGEKVGPCLIPTPCRDPIDQAYVEAEAVLNDEVARRARRSRVLAAVGRQGAPDCSPARRAPSHMAPWGLAAAASVAGLALVVALQIYRPTASPATNQTPTPPAFTSPGDTSPRHRPPRRRSPRR